MQSALLRKIEAMATTEKPDVPPVPNTTAPVPRLRKRRLPLIAGIVAAVVVLGVVIFYFIFVRPYESTDDAFIDGRTVVIAPQVAGRVERLLVNDNQEVKQGDLLIQIDPRDYDTKLAQAHADVAAAKSSFEQAEAQLPVDKAKTGEEQANVIAAEADAARAAADLKRYQTVESRAISQSQLDLAAAQAKSLAAQVDVARNKQREAEAQVALSEANVATAAANVKQKEAMLQQAEINLSYTKIAAPQDGRVTHRSVEAGNYVQVGQAMFAIVPHDVWVTANFKETQLTYMKPGQPVSVRVDAFPQLKFKGHVDSIQAGTGAQFSLLPPENAAGNYVKVVQRVPVKIVFDEIPDASIVLPLGASVVPEVRVK